VVKFLLAQIKHFSLREAGSYASEVLLDRDEMKEHTAYILIPHERVINLVF